MGYILSTDSCCDLPQEMLERYKIRTIALSYNINGTDYTDTSDIEDLQAFYSRMRAGEMPKTSQINMQQFVDYFEPMLKEGMDILHISFSSALSGSCASAFLAQAALAERYPQAKLYVLDSVSASLGEGLLVWHAANMLEAGSSAEQVYNWCEQNKRKINHWFTVDDLGHLRRGGRVSGAAAFVGSILNIKPVLNMDNEGRLVPRIKVQGRNKSLITLVDKMDHNGENLDGQTVFISHGDCLKDAQTVAEIIKQRHKVKQVVIGYIGAVIGAHSGPGTVALFFMGKER